MIGRSYLLAAAALALLPLSALAADGQTPDAPVPPDGAPAKTDAGSSSAGASSAADDGQYCFCYPAIRDVSGRFGYWAMDSSGSPTKVGEFQDLSSSVFWDADGLLSNGCRTLDFTLTGTDEEGNYARGYYYSPLVTVKADYDRYLRQLDARGLVIDDPHTVGYDPIFENFDPHLPQPPAASTQQVLNSDVLNADQDYAIRVQEFNARFHGPIGENLKWRLNVWGIDKQGVRQATRVAHCFNESTVDTTPGTPTGNRCHLLGQPQRIDWSTVEVEPVLEAKIGGITAEYSRTMRSFVPNDQTVTRLYTQSGHPGWPITSSATVPNPDTGQLFNPVPYDVQAENFTQIDRLKLSADLDCYNHLYALMYVGDTKNELRDTKRYFNGVDARWTNDAVEGLQVTAYGKKFSEDGRLPTTFPEAPLIQGGDSIEDYHQPLSYDKNALGLKGRWRPYCSGWPAAEGLAWIGGYEYGVIRRDYANYDFHDPRWIIEDNPSPEEDEVDHFTFVQPDTKIHTFHIGPSMRWSACLDTFVRYKFINMSDPVYGFRATNGDANTNQPEQSNLIEIGGTWMPTDNFMVNATVGMNFRSHSSQQINESAAYDVFHDNPREIDFDEQSYPFVLSTWYAPSPKWSFTGGYARFSNSIDQLITLGDLYDDNLLNATSGSVPGPNPPVAIGARDYFEPDAFQSNWEYRDSAQVMNVGASYAWNACWRLTGGYEFTRSHAGIISAPSPALAQDPSDTSAPPTLVVPDWSLIPSFSDVIVETNRWTAGVDYLMGPRMALFFRYDMFDYDDLAGTGNSGLMHGVLGGMNAVF